MAKRTTKKAPVAPVKPQVKPGIRKATGCRSVREVISRLRVSEPKDVGELAEKMRSDYQVQLSELVLRAVIGSAKISLECEGGDERAELLRNKLENLFRQRMPKMLDCIAYGRVAWEKVWQYSAATGLFYIDALDDLPFAQTEMQLDEEGRFAGIELRVDKDSSLELSAEKSWWLSLDASVLEPHGKSRFAGAPQEIWRRRQEAMRKLDIFLVKHIISNGVAHVPFESELEGGQSIDIPTMVAESLDVLNAGGTAVFSNERDENGNYQYDVELAGTAVDPSPIERLIDGLDVDQLRSFGIPEKTVIEGQSVGSYAMVTLQMLVLYAVCEDILRQIETSYQRFVINKVLDANNLGDVRITISHPNMVNLEDPIMREIVKGLLTGNNASAVLGSGVVDVERLLSAANVPLSPEAGDLVGDLLQRMRATPSQTGPAMLANDPGPLDRLRSFRGAAKGSPTLSGMPTIIGLQKIIAREISRIYAELALEMESLRATHGHVNPTRLQQLLAELSELHANSRTASKILGMVSIWRPQINSKPEGTTLKQVPFDRAKRLLTVTSDSEDEQSGGRRYLAGEAGKDRAYKFPFVEDAVDWLLDKQIATADELGRMASEDRSSVFAAPRIESIPTLEDLRSHVVQSLRTGESLYEFRQRIGDEFDLSRSEVETVYRTNTKQAYDAGMEQTMQKPEVKNLFSYVRYAATADNRVRATHWDLDGFVCSIDDPAYSVLRRALADWNCRCSLIPLTQEQAESGTISSYSDLPVEVLAKYG